MSNLLDTVQVLEYILPEILGIWPLMSHACDTKILIILVFLSVCVCVCVMLILHFYVVLC